MDLEDKSIEKTPLLHDESGENILVTGEANSVGPPPSSTPPGG